MIADWVNLKKTRIVKHVNVTYEEKQLADGVFVCPLCDGEGRVMTVHRFLPPHGYGRCGMCKGQGEIMKCTSCDSPIPVSEIDRSCAPCFMRLKSSIEEFEERCTK